jgi:DNA-binding transcriptional MerR regulator
MRISELGRRSGLPVATIKFYLREGLLPPGTRTARNQAEYDESHLARLRLIQTLTGVGRFSLASVREVLEAVDGRGVSVDGVSAVISKALLPAAHLGEDAPVEGDAARAQVDRFIASLGWRVPPDAAARAAMARVLTVLRQLDRGFTMEFFVPYADAANQLCVHDLGMMPTAGPPERVALEWTARIVLFEAGLVAMRALAHEHQIALRADGVSHGRGK